MATPEETNIVIDFLKNALAGLTGGLTSDMSKVADPGYLAASNAGAMAAPTVARATGGNTALTNSTISEMNRSAGDAYSSAASDPRVMAATMLPTGGLKGGLRAAVGAAGRGVVREAPEPLARLGVKGVAEGVSKGLDDIAKTARSATTPRSPLSARKYSATAAAERAASERVPVKEPVKKPSSKAPAAEGKPSELKPPKWQDFRTVDPKTGKKTVYGDAEKAAFNKARTKFRRQKTWESKKPKAETGYTEEGRNPQKIAAEKANAARRKAAGTPDLEKAGRTKGNPEAARQRAAGRTATEEARIRRIEQQMRQNDAAPLRSPKDETKVIRAPRTDDGVKRPARKIKKSQVPQTAAQKKAASSRATKNVSENLPSKPSNVAAGAKPEGPVGPSGSDRKFSTVKTFPKKKPQRVQYEVNAEGDSNTPPRYADGRPRPGMSDGFKKPEPKKPSTPAKSRKPKEPKSDSAVEDTKVDKPKVETPKVETPKKAAKKATKKTVKKAAVKKPSAKPTATAKPKAEPKATAPKAEAKPAAKKTAAKKTAAKKTATKKPSAKKPAESKQTEDNKPNVPEMARDLFSREKGRFKKSRKVAAAAGLTAYALSPIMKGLDSDRSPNSRPREASTGLTTDTKTKRVDKYGRRISQKEFERREAYRETRDSLTGVSVKERARIRKAEMQRRDKYRDTAGKKQFGAKAVKRVVNTDVPRGVPVSVWREMTATQKKAYRKKYPTRFVK